MCHLMYKEVDIWEFLEEESIKMRPSCLKQAHLPSVFHTEEDKTSRLGKVNATMAADHLMSRGQTRSRKMNGHHLMQLGGVFLPRWVVFLAR